jgi:hypothetical protein
MALVDELAHPHTLTQQAAGNVPAEIQPPRRRMAGSLPLHAGLWKARGSDTRVASGTTHVRFITEQLSYHSFRNLTPGITRPHTQG